MGMITEEQRADAATPAMGLGRHSRMESERSDNAEITLGMRSLLGIFFGLVLICGIFFGLGYSVGRSGGTRAAANEDQGAAQAAANANLKKPSAEQQQSLTPAPAATPATGTGENGTTQTAENGAAPAQQGLTESNTPAPGAAGSGAATSAAPAAVAAPPAKLANPTPAPQMASTQPAPAMHTAPTQTAAVKQPTFTQPAPAPAPRRAVIPQSFTPAPTAAAPVPAASNYATNSYGSGTFMVQIAAVRMQQDANVLVTALQRHGYNVVVRHEAQDTLLHVQIGPFASRTQAFQMRSRLLADGYNAVVK